MNKLFDLPLRVLFEQRGQFDGAAALCPHCGALCSFKSLRCYEWPGDDTRFMNISATPPSTGRNIWLAQCPSCKGGVVGVELHVPEGILCKGEFLWPNSIVWPDRAPPGIEAPIKSAYDEARAVLGISARASAVLARRAIQHVLRAKLNVKHATLFEEIKEAVTRSELTKPTRETLDHVREIGNWGAHPITSKDPAETIIEVSPDDAAYTLQVLELLFGDLYTTPMKIAEMSARIQSKKK